MVNFCAVFGCLGRPKSFYTIPAVVRNKGKQTKELSPVLPLLWTLEQNQRQLKAMSTESSTHSVTRRRGDERYKKLGQKSDSQQSAPRNVLSSRKHSPEQVHILSHDMRDCGNCGRKHPADKSECPANRQTCRNCGKHGHFAKMCRSERHVQNFIHTEETDSDDVEVIHSVRRKHTWHF